ncbi:MAG: RDD family protein [Phycisphaerales bacterium]
MGAFSFWWLWLAVWLSIGSTSLGQVLAGAPDGQQPGNEHAWALTPSTVSSEWALWHVPPRLGESGAADGSVRIVDSLERKPAAMSAAGGRVWMAFAGMGNQAGYGVFTAAVQPGAIAGTWFSGSGGRLASSAFLPTAGKLLSMAARRQGPAVLLEHADKDLEIAWVDRGIWQFSTGPSRGGGASPQAIALSGESVVLSAIDAGRLYLWTATLPKQEPRASDFELRDPAVLLEDAPSEHTQASEIGLQWTLETIDVPTSTDGVRVVAGPVTIGPRSILGTAGNGVVRVLEVEGDAVRPVYEAKGHAVALLPAARRGLIVRMSDDAQSIEGRAATRLEIEEFSLDTSRTLYTGPAIFDGPVSPSDLRILLVLMVLVSASLLLFVVRSSNEAKPFAAPPGCVLAPPMPRILASVGDGLLALLIGGEIAQLLPEGWLAMRVGAEVIDFAPLIMALLFGLLTGAVLESTLGRTPGKLVFGLAVTRSQAEGDARGGIRRPGIGASLTRNAVKWLLPLVALAGAMSPLLRHRGDTLSGLAVVGELAPSQNSGQSDQDSRPDGR